MSKTASFPTSISTFSQDFFQPLIEEVHRAENQRACPEVSDIEWMTSGVSRALDVHHSGRGFLQNQKARGVKAPEVSLFFESLKSKRRLTLSAEVCLAVSKRPQAQSDHLLCSAKELEGFDLYAGDGHFHAAAAHDKRDADGTKYATGHFYALNLRSHALSHLCVADQVERKKEHDMRALKQLEITILRQGAPQGQKVLYVWDRAGIDFRWWYQIKQRSGVYFLSREKVNMKLEVIGVLAFDTADPRNAGVIADELVATSQGTSVRRIRYYCPVREEEFSFITNLMSVPPGLIVHLYRIRWDIESNGVR